MLSHLIYIYIYYIYQYIFIVSIYVFRLDRTPLESALQDLVQGAKNDSSQVKRIVLSCERDMEDFTAAMDAVNVDLDEMRARVDSTHSIITSRQRVEATVTAEISTMRLDMGDMQEALKAHDAWMEAGYITFQGRGGEI